MDKINMYHVQNFLKDDGYWFTYHVLTSYPYGLRRRDALWLMWVARQRELHQDGRSVIRRLIDQVVG
jgi:hypothetical protein